MGSLPRLEHGMSKPAPRHVEQLSRLGRRFVLLPDCADDILRPSRQARHSGSREVVRQIWSAGRASEPKRDLRPHYERPSRLPACGYESADHPERHRSVVP